MFTVSASWLIALCASCRTLIWRTGWPPHAASIAAARMNTGSRFTRLEHEIAAGDVGLQIVGALVHVDGVFAFLELGNAQTGDMRERPSAHDRIQRFPGRRIQFRARALVNVR